MKDIFEKASNRHTLQDGNFYAERKGGETSLGLAVNSPMVEYTSGTLRQYQPELKCYNTYSNLKKYGVETFLVVGFGGGKDLEKIWKIAYLGSETIKDGKADVKVEKIDLAGIDRNMADRYTHITLWVDTRCGISLKQIFYTPGGDTLTVFYADLRINQSIKRRTTRSAATPAASLRMTTR